MSGSFSSASAFTPLALWLTCTAVVVLGKVISVNDGTGVKKEEPPVVIEILNINFGESQDPSLGASDAAPPSAEAQELPTEMLPPAAEELTTPEEATPLTEVNEIPPEPIANEPVKETTLTKPVEKPATKSSKRPSNDTTNKSSDRTANNSNKKPASGSSQGGTGISFGTQNLSIGVGEGRQPSPSYPITAKRARQEGTVVVRFTVGTDGRVTAADAIRPCQWPSLNQAALQTIRSRWRFRAGSVRSYQISIAFQLK